MLRWLLAFMFALILHFGLATYYLYQPKPPMGAEELGVGGFEVSISMAEAQMGAESSVEQMQEEVTEEIVEDDHIADIPLDAPPVEEPPVEEPPVEEVEITEVEDVIEPVIEERDDVEQVEIENAPVLELAEADVVEEEAVFFPRPQTRPVIEPKIKVEQVKAAKPSKALPVPEQQEITQKQEIQKKPQANTQETVAVESLGNSQNSKEKAERSDETTQTGGGMYIGQVNPDYLTELRYWLERHKSYPKYSRRRRQEGVTMLSFMMNREGEVLEFKINKSSGHEKLDAETLAMLERAQPLPKIPEHMSGRFLKVVLPVQFSLSR